MAKVHGMGGAVTVSSTAYHVESWTATFKSENEDVTDTGSAGWRAVLAGVKSAEFTFKIFYDAAIAVSGVFGPGVAATFTGAIGASGDTVVIPAVVNSFAIENPSRNACTLTVTADSNGSCTLPT